MSKNRYPDMADLDVEIASQLRVGELSRYLMALAALRRGLTVRFHTYIADHPSKSFNGQAPNYNARYFSISSADKTVYFDGTQGEGSTAEENNLAAEKSDAKKLFNEIGLLTPAFCEWRGHNKAEIDLFLKETVTNSFVVKPVTGSLGKGVVQKVNREQIERELPNLKGRWLIEEMIEGREFRVFVVDGQAVASLEKMPPQVVGDGRSTYRQLIEAHNQKVQSSAVPFDCVDMDDAAFYLETNAKSLDDIPRFLEPSPVGSAVFVRGALTKCANQTVAKSVKAAAARAVTEIGLPNAGVDVIQCKTTGKPFVLEVNPRANIRHHSFPIVGQGQGLSVPHAILKYYFPETKPQKNLEYFPLNFPEVQKALSAGYLSSVEPMHPERNWVVRHVQSGCSISDFERIFQQLRAVCIFVNWWKRSDGDNRAVAYFLPRGLIGFKKTSIANNLPVISVEVDRQILDVVPEKKLPAKK